MHTMKKELFNTAYKRQRNLALERNKSIGKTCYKERLKVKVAEAGKY
jgi:hypothetical protein